MKQILALPSMDPVPRHHSRWGRICAPEKSVSMHRRKCLTVSHRCPVFFVSLSQNISWVEEEKQGWLTGWSRVSSAASLTAWWCTQPWQLIDSPGLGYREDETCLEHLTRCLCGAPEHCRLNPLWMQARYARLGRFFPSMTDREQNSLHFW